MLCIGGLVLDVQRVVRAGLKAGGGSRLRGGTEVKGDKRKRRGTSTAPAGGTVGLVTRDRIRATEGLQLHMTVPL